MAIGYFRNIIRVWELPRARKLETLTDFAEKLPMGIDPAVRALGYTPDGQFFVSGSDSGDLMLWSVENPGSSGPSKIGDQQGKVMGLAITSDGTLLASADEGGTMRLWSLPSGDAVGQVSIKVTAANTGFETVATSPDGSILAAGGRDELVHVWSLPDLRKLRLLEEQNSDVTALAFTPDGLHLIAASGKSIYLYASDGHLSAKLEGAGSELSCLAVSPDGMRLAVGDEGGGVWIWELPDGELAADLIDLKINKKDTEGVRFRVTGADGKKVTYTLPCGAPVPAGAVCTCNCVGGSLPNCYCVGHSSSGSGSHYWHPC